ncbi:restriction endonuclease subunit S [Marinobacter nauticus]|uniref:Type I restriction endonuclease subunit S n=1 Tax=Marinobacter nauticus TaxID=2743 RepID=A0A1M2UTP8_MARNT|nr:restriction endonuclease subunit S [Marinobacter nauticus]OJS98724.1 type I restriction endonuclease subunit S [Marinobacter nauticus]
MTDSPQVPEQWLSLLIGEVADVVAGGTPKASNPDNFAESGTQIPWLTPADLSKYSEKYISYGARDLSKAGYESSSAKLMPAGTLLFSSRAPIGYVAVAANEISTNQGFKNFVLPAEIDSSYAYYFLRSIRDVAESMGTGTTFKEISGANAKKLPFILPPLAEQKVIADKLDTLLAQVENTKARLERIPQILKRFRQSVLAAAVSGRLTEEWREHSSSQFPYENRELSEIIHEMRNGLSPKPNEDGRGHPILRISSVRPFSLDQIDIRHLEVSEKDKERYSLQPDDLLFTRYNGSIEFVGVCARVSQLNHDTLLYPDKLIRVRVDKAQVIPEFLEIFAASFEARQYIYSLVKSTSGQKGISGKDLKLMKVALPTISEQIEIVRRVDQLLAHADRIEQQINNALARVNNLTQSILAKAFRGELTEQWRKDNPELISGENSAEALLERIKVERARQKPAGRRTKVRKTEKLQNDPGN